MLRVARIERDIGRASVAQKPKVTTKPKPEVTTNQKPEVTTNQKPEVTTNQKNKKMEAMVSARKVLAAILLAEFLLTASANVDTAADFSPVYKPSYQVFKNFSAHYSLQIFRPTILSYYPTIVSYNATSSLVRFENKNIVINFEKMLFAFFKEDYFFVLKRTCCVVNFYSAGVVTHNRRIGSRDRFCETPFRAKKFLD
jgi:hypothetical protein